MGRSPGAPARVNVVEGREAAAPHGWTRRMGRIHTGRRPVLVGPPCAETDLAVRLRVRAARRAGHADQTRQGPERGDEYPRAAGWDAWLSPGDHEEREGRDTAGPGRVAGGRGEAL